MLVLSLKKNDYLKINEGETLIKVLNVNKKGMLVKVFNKENNSDSYLPEEPSSIKREKTSAVTNTLTMTFLKTKGKQAKIGFEGPDEIQRVKGKIKFTTVRPRNLDDDFFNFDTEGY